MAVLTRKETIDSDIHRVWKTVFAVQNYREWRSDVEKTEIKNEKQFVEYTKGGFATAFTSTLIEPYHRWEFEMENANMRGRWVGIFTARGEETQIELTENVIAKKWFMKPLVKPFLKRQQAQFVLDLKKVLAK